MDFGWIQARPQLLDMQVSYRNSGKCTEAILEFHKPHPDCAIPNVLLLRSNSHFFVETAVRFHPNMLYCVLVIYVTCSATLA